MRWSLPFLLVACGTSAAPAPAPAPVAVPEPVVTEPAPAAGPGADLRHGLGHCAPTEAVLMDCGVAGGKRVSLCAHDDLRWMQYRFGAPGAPELVWPEDGAVTGFHYEQTTWARGMEDAVWFERDGTVYRVVDAIGSGIDGPANNYAGVKVLQGGEEVAFVECDTSGDSDLSRLGDVLPR